MAASRVRLLDEAAWLSRCPASARSPVFFRQEGVHPTVILMLKVAPAFSSKVSRGDDKENGGVWFDGMV